jgi:transcriptional regulator with XRE-family HTH domain
VKNLAKNIKFLRSQKKWSQEELATKLDVKRSNIAAYETKNVNPKLEFVVAFSKLFDISISDLIEKDLAEGFREAKENGKESPLDIEPSHVRLEDLGRSPASRDQLDIDDRESVRRFVRRSERIRKMLEGFKAFYRLKMENLRHAESESYHSLAADLENFILLMEHLLAHNETVIRSISRRQKIDWGN